MRKAKETAVLEKMPSAPAVLFKIMMNSKKVADWSWEKDVNELSLSVFSKVHQPVMYYSPLGFCFHIILLFANSAALSWPQLACAQNFLRC